MRDDSTLSASIESLLAVAAAASSDEHPPIETLEDFVLGSGATDRRARVGRHLAACGACAERAAGLLDAHAAAERVVRRRPWLEQKRLSIVAAVAAAAAVVVLVTPGLTPFGRDSSGSELARAYEQRVADLQLFGGGPEPLLPSCSLRDGAHVEFVLRGEFEGLHLIVRPTEAPPGSAVGEVVLDDGPLSSYVAPRAFRVDDLVAALPPGTDETDHVLVVWDLGRTGEAPTTLARLTRESSWPLEGQPPAVRIVAPWPDELSSVGRVGWHFRWSAIPYGSSSAAVLDAELRSFEVTAPGGVPDRLDAVRASPIGTLERLEALLLWQLDAGDRAGAHATIARMREL